MIKSMTGFGRAEIVKEGKKCVVEIKSVNHRYCEVSTKMPKKLYFYDTAVRQLVKKFANRGKIDVFVSFEDDSNLDSCVKYNEALAREYYSYICQISKDLNLANDVSAYSIARMPEVITLEESETNQEKTIELLNETIEKACESFVSSRNIEGEHLKEDIFNKLDGLREIVSKVEKRSPEMMAEYRQKLTDKLKEVVTDTNISEQHIAAELIIYADKVCVDEETVRLRAHIDNMQATLNVGENVGRKLDFLAQEMNREANTILSKANDIEVSDLAIGLKTEIEKIREQIQNIE